MEKVGYRDYSDDITVSIKKLDFTRNMDTPIHSEHNIRILGKLNFNETTILHKESRYYYNKQGKRLFTLDEVEDYSYKLTAYWDIDSIIFTRKIRGMREAFIVDQNDVFKGITVQLKNKEQFDRYFNMLDDLRRMSFSATIPNPANKGECFALAELNSVRMYELFNSEKYSILKEIL